jgi:hypothetical protein
VDLTHLEEWVGGSPFTVDPDCHTPTGPGVSVLYQPTPIVTAFIQCLASELRLLGKFEMKSHRRNELRWSYSRCFEIKPEQPQSWEWFFDVIVGLADMLTLFAWQPIYPRRVVGLGQVVQDEGRDGRILTRRDSTEVFWHFLSPQIEPTFSESNVLIRFGDVQTQFQSVLNAWFSNRKKLGPVLELFFGSLYATKIHGAFQFLAMTQALEGLHRATIGGQYHPDLEYDWYKEDLKRCLTRLPADNDWKNKFINGELKWGNQYSQRKRFKGLLSRIDPALRNLLVRNAQGFVDHIVDTRNYLTHMDQKSLGNALQGHDLIFAFYKVQILVGILLLKEAGFSDHWLAGMLANNHYMGSLLNQAQNI